MKKIIWGNMLVKNEDKFIWYAVKSVIDKIDKLIIWDTGSEDKTLDIIKILKREYPTKIEYKEIGKLDPKGITEARQKMLEISKCDWILIVDGDEVWWKKSIDEVISVINKKDDDLYAVVIPTINLIGDVYHYQEEKAGEYQILGKKGHLNLRAINKKIKGLKVKGDYPLEGFYDGEDVLLQENDEKLIFIDAPVLHFTNLIRSTKVRTDNKRKIKYELGDSFKKEFRYPEVLYFDLPEIVEPVWEKMSLGYKTRSLIETPLKKIKRRLR